MNITKDIKTALFSYCLKLNNKNQQDAEDLYQTVMLKAHTGNYEEQGNLSAFLHRIAHNEFVNNYRKAKYRKAYFAEHYQPHVETTDWNNGECNLVMAEIRAGLQQLTIIDKTILTMRMEGYKYEEVAEHFGWKLGTAKSRIFKARQRLSKIIGYTEGYGCVKAN